MAFLYAILIYLFVMSHNSHYDIKFFFFLNTGVDNNVIIIWMIECKSNIPQCNSTIAQ